MMRCALTAPWAILYLATAACGADPAARPQADADLTEASAPADAPDADAAAVEVAPCTTLFGLPNEKTGLGSDKCVPSCVCGGQDFTPPEYTEQDLARLEARVALDPPASLAADPYEAAAPPAASPGAVCGVVADEADPAAYRLQTFESLDALATAGAKLTHYDGCGLCSSLRDLAVYIRHRDLTEPVRKCGLESFTGGRVKHLACLEALGFTPPCASIWYYNSLHTQQECFELCIAALDEPYHLPDGSLNACLRCDEDASGAVFKAVAGRTRRNTGVPSSMCRPCAEARPVLHDYESP